jgi:uncharacterized protein (TIGR00369 family)
MSENLFSIATMQTIVDHIRHCVVLGIKVESIEDKTITLSLPYSEKIVGDPDSKVVHGGAITTLLDTACGMAIPLGMQDFQIAPTLDLRIDYMTAAAPEQTIYGRAETYRITKNVVFCRGIAFQQDDSKPIAHCVATFMRLSSDVTNTRISNGKISAHD